MSSPLPVLSTVLTRLLAGFIISFFFLVVFRLVIALSVPLLFIGMMYSSMWAVQIYRTARRGRASGLTGEYLLGITVCRLYFLLCTSRFLRCAEMELMSGVDYLACPKNILDIEPRRTSLHYALFFAC